MTVKQPVLSIRASNNSLTFVSEAVAATAIRDYVTNIAQCVGSGHMPHPPQIPVVIKGIGKERKTLVRPGTTVVTETTSAGIRITVPLVEYDDLKRREQEHRRGEAVVFSERPTYEPGPDDHGE